MASNRFRKTLLTVEAEILAAQADFEELLDFLNSEDGFNWLFHKRLKGGAKTCPWMAKKFALGTTDGYLFGLHEIHERLPPRPREVDLWIFLQGKKGIIKKIFFGERINVCFPKVELEPFRRLSYSDRFTPECQDLARTLSLQHVRGKAFSERPARYEAFIYDTQATDFNPFVCMVIERFTPETMVKRLGAKWVIRMCKVFEEILTI